MFFGSNSLNLHRNRNVFFIFLYTLNEVITVYALLQYNRQKNVLIDDANRLEMQTVLESH